METTTWTIHTSLIGGCIIGISLLLMIVFNGKIAGTSGVLGGLLMPNNDSPWKMTYIGGMIFGGLVWRLILEVVPASFFDAIWMKKDEILPLKASDTPLSASVMLVAGILVGFGTRYGSGCTSGHGLCGLARFSPRSFLAVTMFFGTGIIVASAMSKALW
ncbi:protein of unknown function (DUF4341) [Carpediemonas membranifera]|uniref:Sulphur transport domain-containing protein n=1 Tax=Carpediemonas membranifera TaxID=201153 RepID=A0A8J6BA68_9EUKA|nr:protein of unknown function (DUF4341) [Carpediemonas membranifera]|eukprot:KAG9396479.1 protein of unknown function (DUF4341) [Carpediemonas membranifera]